MSFSPHDPLVAKLVADARAEGRIVRETGPPAAKGKREKPALVAATASLCLTVVVPLRLVSAANKREHWAARHRRVAAEVEAVKTAALTSSYVNAALQGLTFQFARDDRFRVAVTLTRLGGRKWDDDNNVSGLKGVRDAVANWWLMRDDGDERVRFACDQEPGGAFGVRIEITTEGVEA